MWILELFSYFQLGRDFICSWLNYISAGTGGQMYFWFNPDKDKLPSATWSPCLFKELQRSSVLLVTDWTVVRSSDTKIHVHLYSVQFDDSIFPIRVCPVVYTPLHHTRVHPHPSAISSSVFKEAGGSWLLACHGLSHITCLSDMSSSYLPLLQKLLKQYFSHPKLPTFFLYVFDS